MSEPVDALEAILAWRNKKLHVSLLMRALAAHKGWEIPLSENAAAETLATNSLGAIMTYLDPDGKTSMLLFTGIEAFRTYQKALGEAGNRKMHFLTTDGATVFKLPFEKIDFVNIDPYSEHNLVLSQPYIDRLRSLPEALKVESAIDELRNNPSASPELYGVVKKYANFYLPLKKDGEAYSIALAPDTKGRPLAAVFTAEDAFNAYSQWWEDTKQTAELIVSTMDGEKAFGHLSRAPVDGIVINCEGPTKPVAFIPQFALEVLKG